MLLLNIVKHEKRKHICLPCSNAKNKYIKNDFVSIKGHVKFPKNSTDFYAN